MKINDRSFPDFIKEIENLSYPEMLEKCQQIGGASEKENNSYLKSLPKKERKFASDNNEFIREMGTFTFWLRSCRLFPETEYLDLYRQIANNLIQKGQLKKEALNSLTTKKEKNDNLV